MYLCFKPTYSTGIGSGMMSEPCEMSRSLMSRCNQVGPHGRRGVDTVERRIRSEVPSVKTATQASAVTALVDDHEAI